MFSITPPVNLQSVTVSVAVYCPSLDALGWVLEPGVKLDGAYYCNIVLSEQLLCAICHRWLLHCLAGHWVRHTGTPCMWNHWAAAARDAKIHHTCGLPTIPALVLSITSFLCVYQKTNEGPRWAKVASDWNMTRNQQSVIDQAFSGEFALMRVSEPKENTNICYDVFLLNCHDFLQLMLMLSWTNWLASIHKVG